MVDTLIVLVHFVKKTWSRVVVQGGIIKGIAFGLFALRFPVIYTRSRLIPVVC